MNENRKVLYISAITNFVVGVALGIALFYGQIKSTGEIKSLYEYDATVTLSDFFRLSWLNVLWMLSAFFARCMLPISAFHPILTLRGVVSSFSMLYILSSFSMREAVATVLPQTFSVLPLLLYFSVETVEKYRSNLKKGYDVCSLKRKEIATIFSLAMIAGAAEVLVFKFFCNYLF